MSAAGASPMKARPGPTAKHQEFGQSHLDSSADLLPSAAGRQHPPVPTQTAISRFAQTNAEAAEAHSSLSDRAAGLQSKAIRPPTAAPSAASHPAAVASP